MKKYAVRLYYDTYTEHEVYAKSESEALEKAREQTSTPEEVYENLDLDWAMYDIEEI